MIDPNRLVRAASNEIASGVWYVPAIMANLYMVGERGGPWVLVDAGVRGTAWRIGQAARSAFGDRPPAAIVLTHGHFGRVGALPALMRDWHAPIYAHTLELPYLTGRPAYPPPDPTVGGFMAQLSRVFPNTPYDFGDRMRAFAGDGSLPEMPGWQWIYTPGHCPGHVSLFRAEDRCLVAGDAVITIDQDHPGPLVTQERIIRRPPSYFTQDWVAAADSVRRLAELRPHTLATGHGLPMVGAYVAEGLEHLARTFTPPAQGRYVAEPARADESGTTYVPPAFPDPVPGYVLAGVAAAVVAGAAISARRRA